MRVSYLKLTNPALAERLLTSAERLDAGRFLGAGARRRNQGVEDAGQAVLDHAVAGAAIPVARVAMALRQPGRAGLVRSSDDGKWYLVRVETVRLERQPWTAPLAVRVKTAMAWEREQRHLRALTTELSRKWPVRVHAERLSAVRTESGG